VLKGCARFPGLHGTCEIEEIEMAIEIRQEEAQERD